MSHSRKVLLIGDSISIGYEPFVREQLADEFAVAHHEGNGGDSERVATNLDTWLAAEPDAAVIHFNCGLHDIKLLRESGKHQVPLANYRENLTKIVGRLKPTGKTTIWASTTPVIYERHHAVKTFDRGDEDVAAYNAAAAEIVSAAGIPINDLYEVVRSAGPEKLLGKDGVHFTDEGYKILGHAVSRAIRKHAGT